MYKMRKENKNPIVRLNNHQIIWWALFFQRILFLWRTLFYGKTRLYKRIRLLSFSQNTSSRFKIKMLGLIVIFCILNTSLITMSSFSSLTHASPAKDSKATKDISAIELKEQIKEIIQKIPELVWIRELAQQKGLKVWLFGGTASSFAHYVKESILFDRGSNEFYSEHFAEDAKGQRDYTDIFRPTQDIDLVVDGNLEEIETFEKEIRQHYAHLQGAKGSKWEVRPLRENYKDKQALLKNPDFLNQHTDSHSVGMISLSTTAKEKVIKDLFDWESKSPQFLQDVLTNKLHFYNSDKHQSTSRYKEGKNPEIFSVIRYFIKLFQHELTPQSEDLKKIKEIIKNTQWSSIQTEGYINYWLQKNVPKLFLHAKNVEYASEVLEKVGLKEKLLQVGSIDEEKSPAWWVNKEPLRSFEVGQGQGKTAKELGIEIVSHDTVDFFIWTVITRSRKGEPNVFISREGIVGESAAHGNGFYTVPNRRKGFGHGFTIRFTLDPEAREGTDFSLHNDILLVLNRKAIKVIPESITVPTLLEYFEILRDGGFSEGDEGLLEKLRRKLENKSLVESSNKEETAKIIELLRKENKAHLWKEWYALKISIEYPELIETAISKGDQKVLENLAEYTFPQPHWKDHPEFVQALIEKGDQYVLENLAKYILSQPHWKDHPELIQALIDKGDSNILQHLAIYTLSQSHWKAHPELVQALIDKGDSNVLWNLAKYTLSQPHWKNHSNSYKPLSTKEVNGF